ncbi:hypothetical protein OAS67_06480 [Alphaproteobacteria bacterium]|nr:hypothetical protein [Alphaproteobacteria bacterium]
MSMTLVAGRENQLTLDEHVQRLLDARTKMRDGLWEFIDALKDAYDQLPPNTFQNEIGIRLEMRKSTLSRWISIASSDYLRSKRDKLPAGFYNLYVLTLIEKKYLQHYGQKCFPIMDILIKSGQITPHSERSDLEIILQEITQRVRRDDQLRRQEAILSLSGGKFAPDRPAESLEEYLEDKTRFRSFVVMPPEILMRKWSDNGYFASDIAEEFPLHDLRAPSMAETLSCLIKVKMRDIETGIKLINAWGFAYRDAIVPPTSNDRCTVLVDEYVLLRGERGQGKRITTKACLSFETDDILEFAEQNSAKPNLLVFNTTGRTDWSCLSAIK